MEFSLKIIGAALAGGILVQLLVSFLLTQYATSKAWQVDLRPIIPPLRLLIPAVCVGLTLPALRLSGKWQSFFEHALQLWIMACIGWLITRVIRIIRDSLLNRYQNTNVDYNGRRIYTQVRIIEHILNLVIWILTMALMIMTFSEVKEIGMSIFASAGIMSVIIGLAAQKTLGNVIAGIQIAMSQPIRIEDSIMVEGEFGNVEEITLTYVVVRLWDLRRMILPISYFIEKPFQNWTRTSAEMMGTVEWYVDYTVPVQEMRNQLTELLQKSRLWSGKVNVLQVTDIKEQTLVVRALVDARDAGQLFDLRCEIREGMLDFLREHAIFLPQTRIELHRPITNGHKLKTP